MGVRGCQELHTDLDKGMEETKAKQQLLEGRRLLAAVEEGWVTDRVIEITLQQIGSQSLHALHNMHQELKGATAHNMHSRSCTSRSKFALSIH